MLKWYASGSGELVDVYLDTADPSARYDFKIMAKAVIFMFLL
jgi:hypothetical protein